MKQILVAIDNIEVLEYIKNINGYKVYEKDISYKEGVIEYLSRNDADYIITKDTLEGEMTREIYIKQIRMIYPDIKIILFVDYLDERYKQFLFANEVFNIVEQKQITRELIAEVLEDSDRKVIYKTSNFENKKKYVASEDETEREDYEANDLNLKIITKQTIAVFGTSGAGKSYISNIVSNIIGQKIGINTLLIDLDIQNGSTDIYTNLSGESDSLSEVINEIDNNNFTEKTFEKHIHKSSDNINISYLTNNSSLFECQNKLSSKYYKKILDKAKNCYDAIIIDTPNSIFLDATYFALTSADTVMFVVNPNYISVRQAAKYLDLVINVWNVPKNKIFLVVNRIKKDSLGIKQIESLTNGIKVKLEITENQNIDKILNGLGNITLDNIEDLTNIYEIFGKNLFKKSQIKKPAENMINKLLEGIRLKQ